MLVDDPLDLDTFRATAAHEAAHAVVTAGLSIPVRRILVVQLTGELKQWLPTANPKENCSHSEPDKVAYRAPDRKIHRCLVARAGEVGQRLSLKTPSVLQRDQWECDVAEIERETELVEEELEVFLETLGVPVETWLNEPEPQQVWTALTHALIGARLPHPSDPKQCWRSELTGTPLDGLLAGTPEFPTELRPVIPAPTTETVTYRCTCCGRRFPLEVTKREQRSGLRADRTEQCWACGQRVGTGHVHCRNCGERFEIALPHAHVNCEVGCGECPTCKVTHQGLCICPLD